MTNSLCLLPMWQLLRQVWQHQSPPCESQISPTSRYEPEPYIRTTATNGDSDATAETPTAETATTAPGADENDDGLDDNHEYVNTKTDKLRLILPYKFKCHLWSKCSISD